MVLVQIKNHYLLSNVKNGLNLMVHGLILKKMVVNCLAISNKNLLLSFFVCIQQILLKEN